MELQCELITWLRRLAHHSDQPLHQHQAVGAPLLIRHRQLQPLQEIPVYTFTQEEHVAALVPTGTGEAAYLNGVHLHALVVSELISELI